MPTSSSWWLPFVAAAAAASCHRDGRSASPTVHDAASASMEAGGAGIAPTDVPGTPSSDVPGAPPPVERACATDADCAVSTEAVSGAQVCCASCATTPGNRRWYAALQRYCGRHPASNNPECSALACPLGPTIALCRDHVCEATAVGADGGPSMALNQRVCTRALVDDAWDGCVLVGGSTQNGYFVQQHFVAEPIARGEPATLTRVCAGDAGCFDAARLFAPRTLGARARATASAPAPTGVPAGGPGYACRLADGDHDAPMGRCVATTRSR